MCDLCTRLWLRQLVNFTTLLRVVGTAFIFTSTPYGKQELQDNHQEQLQRIVLIKNAVNWKRMIFT